MSARSLFGNLSRKDLSPELSRAARWIEGHQREVALHSMRECARRAGIAPATLTRLSKALGFTGFEALKTLCQEAFTVQAGYVDRAEVLQANARQSRDWLSALNQAQQANTASVITLNSRDQLERAADAMLAADRVNFLGLRASHGLALHLHYTYGLLASNGVLVQGLGGTLGDQIGEMGPRDLLVVLSFAPYTQQTVWCAEQAQRQGVALLAVTDSALSPVARSAAHVLLYRADSTSYFHSTLGALALAESLAAAVAVRGGRKVLARLQSRQQRLEREGAYWTGRAEAAAVSRAMTPRRAS